MLVSFSQLANTEYPMLVRRGKVLAGSDWSINQINSVLASTTTSGIVIWPAGALQEMLKPMLVTPSGIMMLVRRSSRRIPHLGADDTIANRHISQVIALTVERFTSEAGDAVKIVTLSGCGN